MLKTIKQRLGRDDEQGFTLIELMVVVLIIAILLAIAIPTFLGARNNANSNAAKADLRNAITAEQAYWTNNQAFGNDVAMNAAEPNLTWQPAASTTPNQTAVLVGTVPATGQANAVVLVQAQGKDNKCYSALVSNDSASSFTGYNVKTGACAAPGLPAALTAPTAGSAGTPANITAGGYYSTW